VVTLLIRNGEQVYSQWIDSISSVTKCIKTNVKTTLDSFDSGYIRYSLLEPSFITSKDEDVLHLGVRKDDESDDIYRYTGIFFFDLEFNRMIKNAEEIEITFDLEYDKNYEYYIENSSNDDKVFRNSVILKGHSFRNFYDLREHWDTIGVKEFTTNYYCPFVCSIYEELRDAIANKERTFSFKLNNSLLRDFESYGVRGLHLFCQNEIDGHWKIKNVCNAKITRFRSEYNNVIASKESAIYKNTRELKTAKVKRTKLIEQDTLLCGDNRQHVFYFFGDSFNDSLHKAKSMKITFNLSWYNPSISSDLNDISINENFSNSAIKLVGHTFKTLDEVKELGSDKYAIFELHEGEDINYQIIKSDFKTFLLEGRTTYSIDLDAEDIEALKAQNIQGFRIGKSNDNLAGQWIMSDHCEVKITEYINDMDVFDYPLDDNVEWIFKNKPVLVGANKDISVLEHAGFYFFRNFKDELNMHKLKSIRIRLHHEYNAIRNSDSPYKKHLYICGHNFKTVEEAEANDYNYRNHIISIFKPVEGPNADYSDLYITDKDLINKILEYDGLCVYSMRNSSLSVHGSNISIFINYDNGIVEMKNRVFSYLPNGPSDAVANTYLNGSKTVDDRFLCGNIEGNLLKPFLFFKSDLHDFLNSNINIQSIEIRLVAGESIEKDINGLIYKSVQYLDNVELYSHNIKYDQIYCYCYQYEDKLCNTMLMTGQYTSIKPVDPVVMNRLHLINTMKNSYGIGAYALNAKNSEFVYLKECQIIVNYTE
jgi:hypothetical protein